VDRPPLTGALPGAPAGDAEPRPTPSVDVPTPPAGSLAAAESPKVPLEVLLFLGGLVMSVFAGNSKLIGFPVPPDRLLFGSSLALLLFRASRTRRPGTAQRALLALMVATVAWVIASGLTTRSLLTSFGFFALLDRIVLPFVFFMVAGRVFGEARSRHLLLRVLVLLGLYLGATAFFEVVGPHALVFPGYIIDPDVGISFGRARGPFLASDADGLVMVACGGAAVLACLRWRGVWRLVALAASLTCALGALLTLTRSIWVGAVVALVLAGVTAPRVRRWLPMVLAVLGIGVVTALSVLPGLHEDAFSRAADSRSVYDRQNTNAAALRAIEEHPLTGVGWMRFIDVSDDYVRQSEEYPITNTRIEVHNVVLGRAAELGLPGAMLWVLCVLAGPVRAAVRRVADPPDVEGWRPVLVASLACWLVAIMFSPVPYPLPNFLVWLLGGMVAACGRGVASERHDMRERTSPSRDPAGATR
jgi:putative inorganic carbon (HCO3(-)) transporter